MHSYRCLIGHLDYPKNYPIRKFNCKVLERHYIISLAALKNFSTYSHYVA